MLSHNAIVWCKGGNLDKNDSAFKRIDYLPLPFTFKKDEKEKKITHLSSATSSMKFHLNFSSSYCEKKRSWKIEEACHYPLQIYYVVTGTKCSNKVLIVCMLTGVYVRNKNTSVTSHEDRSRVRINVGMGLGRGLSPGWWQVHFM